MTGVDAATAALFLETLGDLREQGRTVVISTHDLGWAAQHCDLICLLAGRCTPSARRPRRSPPSAWPAPTAATTIEVGGVRILAPEGHHH